MNALAYYRTMDVLREINEYYLIQDLKNWRSGETKEASVATNFMVQMFRVEKK